MPDPSSRNSLLAGIAPRPGTTTRAAVVEAAAAAAALYRDCVRSDDVLPEPYRTGGEWANYVADRQVFHQAMLEDRIEEVADTLSAFWRNDLGPIVSQYAYYPHLASGDPDRVARFTERMPADVAAWKAITGDDLSTLAVPDVGHPWGWMDEDVLITPLAMRFDLHARRIASLLGQASGPTVLEIGGGYGGMAHRLVQRIPRVTYVDIDLPETLAIAAFNLRLVLPDAEIVHWKQGLALDAALFASSDIVLAPHHALPTVEGRSVDLVLNAFSLSEMPWRTVEEYVAQIQRVARTWFLQNNVDRLGVVNRGHERVPCSRFPIDPDIFGTVSWTFDTFQGPTGDYRESLHRRW